MTTTPQPKGSSTAFAIIVTMAACGVALFAFLFTSQATAGPTIMGFALLLGIVARMLQASAYEKRR